MSIIKKNLLGKANPLTIDIITQVYGIKGVKGFTEEFLPSAIKERSRTKQGVNINN